MIPQRYKIPEFNINEQIGMQEWNTALLRAEFVKDKNGPYFTLFGKQNGQLAPYRRYGINEKRPEEYDEVVMKGWNFCTYSHPQYGFIRSIELKIEIQSQDGNNPKARFLGKELLTSLVESIGYNEYTKASMYFDSVKKAIIGNIQIPRFGISISPDCVQIRNKDRIIIQIPTIKTKEHNCQAYLVIQFGNEISLQGEFGRKAKAIEYPSNVKSESNVFVMKTFRHFITASRNDLERNPISYIKLNPQSEMEARHLYTLLNSNKFFWFMKSLNIPGFALNKFNLIRMVNFEISQENYFNETYQELRFILNPKIKRVHPEDSKRYWISPVINQRLLQNWNELMSFDQTTNNIVNRIYQKMRAAEAECTSQYSNKGMQTVLNFNQRFDLISEYGYHFARVPSAGYFESMKNGKTRTRTPMNQLPVF